MKIAKLDGNFYVKVYTKDDEEAYLEVRGSKAIKQTDGFETLRYQPMLDETTVILVVEKEGGAEIPVGFAVVQCLDDPEYQKVVSRYFGIELHCKYFVSDFVVTRNYRRSGIGKLFAQYMIEDCCRNESLMMNPNENDSLYWNSLGFTYVGTDRKHGMRIN